MFRPALLVLALMFVASLPARAIDIEENAQGQVEFAMPSGNVGCTYTPKGGTDTYEPTGGGPELSCDRVEPAYVRVILGPKGQSKRYNDVGDASCCSADTILNYGETWTRDGYRCVSSEAGLKCKRGGHGFSLSRKTIKTW